MSIDFSFTDAIRQAKPARIAIDGPSGAGKTWTALAFAAALSDGQRFGVVDTEHGSASLYAGTEPGEFQFQTLPLSSYNPAHIPAILAASANAGHPAIVIDSLSHFWSGVDGMLEQVNKATNASRSRNSFGSGWKEAKPVERRAFEAILAHPGHVIITLRVKTEYVIEENDRGKKEPAKVGLKPEQRADIEYEFDVYGSLSRDHTLTITKSRCPALSDRVVPRPDGTLAQELGDWLAGGAAPPSARDFATIAIATDTDVDLRALYGEAERSGLLAAPVKAPNGADMSLGELINRRGQQIRAAMAGQRSVRPAPTAAADGQAA